jgi:hypothetical protein
MNAKFLAIMKRHGDLAVKISSGKATDAEKSELENLSKTVQAMTDPGSVDVGKTTLKTMTVAEFKKYAEQEQAAIAVNPVPSRAALLKRNIDAVKEQGKTKLTDMVAVYFPVKMTADDRIDGVENKLDQVLETLGTMKAAFDGRTQSGVGDGGDDEDDEDDGDGDGDGDNSDSGDDGDDTNKGDAPTAQALAGEAIDALISRFQKLKEKLDAGTLKMEDVHEMWSGQWQMETLIEGAAAVLTKCEELSELIGDVIPAVKKLGKDSGNDAGDDNDNNADDSDDDADNDDNGDDDGSDVAKTLVSGVDLSPSMDDNQLYGTVKNYKNRK